MIDMKERIVPDELIVAGLLLFFTKGIVENEIPVYILPVRVIAGFSFLFILFFFQKVKLD